MGETMESLKEPGITIKFIRLLRANVEMVNADGQPQYNLRLVGLARRESPDGKVLDVQAVFDIMHGIEKPLFNFTCEYIARYERQGENSLPWSEFTTPLALAHLVPYLREFISNVTNRLPAPVLMLDPINTGAMMADYIRRSQQSGEGKSTAAQAGTNPP